jgi:hypothetical protein
MSHQQWPDQRDQIFEVVTLQVGATRLGAVLEDLLPTKDGFRVSVQSGVLVISHKDVPGSHVNLLDTTLRGLTIPRSTVPEASLLVQMELAKQLKPGPQGWAGNYSPSRGRLRVGPFKWTRVTVREALNRIVGQHGDAAWVVDVQPRLLGQMQSRGLWTTVEYDNLPEGLGQTLRKRVLPE